MKKFKEFYKRSLGVIALAFLLIACNNNLDSSNLTPSSLSCRKPITVGRGGAPTARFTVSQSKYSHLSFDASLSSSPGGAIVKYRWQFDTTSRSGKHPFAIYAIQDNRLMTVTLTVTDRQGNATSACARVNKEGLLSYPNPIDPGNP